MSRCFWSFALLVAGSVIWQGMLPGTRQASAASPSDQLAGESMYTVALAPNAPAVSPQTLASGDCCENSCDYGCESGCSGRKWIVEVESVFLAPSQHQHFGGIGLGAEGIATENDGAFVMTPRLTVGVQGERWGLLGRYWRLETGELDADLSGARIFNQSCLEAETIDLEVTRLFTVNTSELRLSVGARYGQWNESASLATDVMSPYNYYSGSVFGSHDFSGTGLTIGLMGRRPVGDRNFHLFVDGRVSVLWDGNTSSCAVTRATYTDVTQSLGSLDQAIMENDGNLVIGEIRVGGEWEAPLRCIPATAFLRLAFEYQYWSTNDVGEAAAVSMASPAGADAMIVSGRSQSDASMGLVGFTLGTGLNW